MNNRNGLLVIKESVALVKQEQEMLYVVMWPFMEAFTSTFVSLSPWNTLEDVEITVTLHILCILHVHMYFFLHVC